MSPTMKYIYGVFLLVLAVGFLVYLAVELVGWRRGRSIINRTQRLLRVSGAVVILTALGMMFYGVFFLKLDRAHPQPYLLYWAALVGMVIIALCLAVIDVRYIVRYQRERERELFQDFASALSDHVHRTRATPDAPVKSSDNHHP